MPITTVPMAMPILQILKLRPKVIYFAMGMLLLGWLGSGFLHDGPGRFLFLFRCLRWSVAVPMPMPMAATFVPMPVRMTMSIGNIRGLRPQVVYLGVGVLLPLHLLLLLSQAPLLLLVPHHSLPDILLSHAIRLLFSRNRQRIYGALLRRTFLRMRRGHYHLVLVPAVIPSLIFELRGRCGGLGEDVALGCL